MISRKRVAFGLSAAVLSLGLIAGTPAIAQQMAQDSMKKDTMGKDSMSKDNMKK